MPEDDNPWCESSVDTREVIRQPIQLPLSVMFVLYKKTIREHTC